MAIRLYQASCAIRMSIYILAATIPVSCNGNFHSSLSCLLIFRASFYQFSCNYVLFSSAMTASVHARIFKPCRCSHLWFSKSSVRSKFYSSISAQFCFSGSTWMIPAATSHDVWACKLTLDSALVGYQIKSCCNVIYGQHTMHCHDAHLASMIGLQVIY